MAISGFDERADAAVERNDSEEGMDRGEHGEWDDPEVRDSRSH
jgi:hypothetical protein